MMRWPKRNPAPAYYGTGMGVAKLLHKLVITSGQLVHCTSDQVRKPRMNTNTREILLISVYCHPFALQRNPDDE